MKVEKGENIIKSIKKENDEQKEDLRIFNYNPNSNKLKIFIFNETNKFLEQNVYSLGE